MTTTPAVVAAPNHSIQSSLSSSSSFDTRRLNTKRIAAITTIHTHPCVRVRAGSEGETPALHHAETIRRPVLRRKKPSPSPAEPIAEAEEGSALQTVMVEEDGVSLEGVAKVDREDNLARPSWGRIGLLAGGDILALVTFAAIGRFSHGMSVLDWDAVRTADPFIAGWLLGSYFLGGYGPEGQGLKGLSSAAIAAAKSWAVGVPLGLAIRGLATGHVPPQSFILLSLGSLLVLMVGWRSTFTWIFPNDEKSLEKTTGNRQGGVLEFFEMGG